MKNMNMPQKFICAFLLLFVLPISGIVFVSSHNYSKTIMESTVSYVTQISNGMMNSINSQINETIAMSKTPYFLSDLQKEAQSASTVNGLSRMSFYIRLISKDQDSGSVVYIYNNAGRVFYNVTNQDARAGVEGQYEYFKKIAYEANGSPVVLGTTEVKDNKGRIKHYITVVRSIKELDTYAQVGVTVIDLDIETFSRTIRDLDSITGGTTMILDENNTIMYSSDKSNITQQYQNQEVLAKLTRENGNFEIGGGSGAEICIYAKLPKNNWRFVVSIPKDVLFRDAANTNKYIIWISLAAGAMAFGFFVVLSYSITKPLHKLIALMKMAERGNFSVRFPVRHNDEVGKVGAGFNYMLIRLNELINEVYVTKLNKKQAELDALQGQINPHFIYNTLETIRMEAILHNVRSISDIAVIFGRILRYSINRVDETVTIRNEMEHIQNYMLLQNRRFSGKFSLNILISQDIMETKIVKLIFQPLIENAIMHGLEQKEAPGVINITAERDSEFTTVTIRDNGLGIEQEKLESLAKRIQDVNVRQKTKDHIGIKNVLLRLKLYFGDSADLVITSEPNVGTTVIMKLPAKTEEPKL